MKRLLLALVACCFCIAMTNAQVERKVMIEQFTNASCAPCAAQNPDFNALLKPNEDRVIALKYQWYFPGYDPMHEQNPSEVNTRIGYYGINGVPTAAIDGVVPGDSYGGGVGNWNVSGGGYAGGPYGYNQAVLDYAMGQPTNIEMELDHRITTKLDSIYIDVVVRNVGNTAFNPRNGRLFIAITEEQINFEFAPGSNGETEFSHVMRKMVPGIDGTSISSIPANSEVTFNFGYPLPGYIYDYSQIGVVAFVHDVASREMFQAERSVKQPLPSGGTYARISMEDRTDPATTPCEQKVTPKVLVTNTLNLPLSSFTASYSINGADPVTFDWTGTLEQNEFTVVNFGEVTLPGAGNYEISYEITDFNNDPDIIVIDQASTSLTSEAVINALPTDAIGEDASYTLENDVVESLPANTVSDYNNGIASTFQTVDRSVYNVSRPIGAFGQSEKAIVLDFYNWSRAQTGVSQAVLTFAKVDLSNFSNAFFRMDWAYGRFPNALDRLEILASTDCGENWDVVARLAGARFATVTGVTTEFVPMDDQWKTDNWDLTDYVGQEVTLGIRAITDNGNNAYLDNIRVAGGLATSTAEIDLLSGKVNIFPNPAEEGKQATIAFELAEATEIDVDVYDITGKHVARVIQGEKFGEGSHVATWENVAESGVYLVKITSANGEVTKKLTVF